MELTPHEKEKLDAILSPDSEGQDSWDDEERSEVDADRAFLLRMQRLDARLAESKRPRSDRLLDYVVGDIRARSHGSEPREPGDDAAAGGKWWDRFKRATGQFYQALWTPLLPSRPADLLDRPETAPAAPVSMAAMARAVGWGVAALAIILVMLSPNVPTPVDHPSDPIYETLVAAAGGDRVKLSSHTQAILRSDTRVRQHSDWRIELEHGAVWLDVEPGGAGFMVDTAHGQVRVIGTSFGVERLDGAIRIDVSEGTVTFARQDDRLTTVTMGQALLAKEDGTIERVKRAEAEHKAMWVRAIESRWIADRHPALVAYWPMEPVDSPEGRILVDQGPHGLRALTTGPVTLTDSVDPLFGGATLFSRSAKTAARIPTPTPLNALDTDITFMCWARPSHGNHLQRFMSSKLMIHGFNVGLGDSTFDLNLAHNEFRAAIPEPFKGKWSHFAFTHSAIEGVTRYYFNGDLIAEKAQSRKNYQPANVDWYLGRNRLPGDPNYGYGPNHFDGALDEIRIYKQALTAEEIRQISMVDLIEQK